MQHAINEFHANKDRITKEQLLKHFGTLDVEFLKSRVTVRVYPTIEEWYDGEKLIFRIASKPNFKATEARNK